MPSELAHHLRSHITGAATSQMHSHNYSCTHTICTTPSSSARTPSALTHRLHSHNICTHTPFAPTHHLHYPFSICTDTIRTAHSSAALMYHLHSLAICHLHSHTICTHMPFALTQHGQGGSGKGEGGGWDNQRSISSKTTDGPCPRHTVTPK